MDILEEKYRNIVAEGLALNMERGQPADENFDLSNQMLTIVGEDDLITPSGLAIRNYPGGVSGIAEAKELFAPVLRAKPSQMLVGGNSSLKIIADLLLWARVRGLRSADGSGGAGFRPWSAGNEKFIVTVPGYDRHFTLLTALGFELLPVRITPEGPDVEEIERIAASDPTVKGLMFVPTYSNPTGDSISETAAKRLCSMKAAARDFTIFADDAYAIHHLYDDGVPGVPLLERSISSGNPDRTFVFGSTSKITFSGAGIGFMAASEANLARVGALFSSAYIGPNKVEQYRHVKFLSAHPGGIAGLMRRHAEILRPKFEAVEDVFERELGGSGLARWTKPRGGYFVSLDTTQPVARRVVELAKGAGVALTAAGATYPGGVDPTNTNIRIAPTRPPIAEVRRAMEVVALCIRIASSEKRSAG